MYNNILKKRVLFVGIPDMAYVCLDGLHASGVNIVGVLGPKKEHPTFLNFRNFTLQKNLNYLDYDNLDEPALIKEIQDLNIDIAVVCSFNYKIPKDLLETVKDGFINIHPSLLPKYRGPNPYSSVILNGETETGVTLHFMDEDFDTGDIIAQKKLLISEYETMGTLFNRTNIIALEMLIDTLRKYETSELPREKQPEGSFPIGGILQEETLFIDYKKPAEEINNLIRALNPFVLARSYFRGTLTKILSADIIKTSDSSNIKPGEIIDINNDKVYIATGNGIIAPTSMQFGSFFASTSKEFINILNPRVGEKFE